MDDKEEKELDSETPKACSLAVTVFHDLVTQSIVASNAHNTTIRSALKELVTKFIADHEKELPRVLSDISELHRQWVVRCQIAEDKATARQEARGRAKKDANSLWKTALIKHTAQLNETNEEKEARIARATVLAVKKQRRQRREEEAKRQMEEEMEAQVEARVEAQVEKFKRKLSGFEEEDDDEML